MLVLLILINGKFQVRRKEERQLIMFELHMGPMQVSPPERTHWRTNGGDSEQRAPQLCEVLLYVAAPAFHLLGPMAPHALNPPN